MGAWSGGVFVNSSDAEFVLYRDRPVHGYIAVVCGVVAVLALVLALGDWHVVARVRGSGVRSVLITGVLSVSAVYLLGCVVASARRLLERDPILIADDAGLRLFRGGEKWRPWGSVVAIHPVHIAMTSDGLLPEWMVRRQARVNYGSFLIEFDDGSRFKVADKPENCSMEAFRDELERRWLEQRSAPGPGDVLPH
jgi:hypothetical protein